MSAERSGCLGKAVEDVVPEKTAGPPGATLAGQRREQAPVGRQRVSFGSRLPPPRFFLLLVCVYEFREAILQVDSVST